MAKNMNCFYWGFIFTCFHINIGVIDFLPNIVGCIAFSIAFEQLGEENSRFNLGMISCWLTYGINIFQKILLQYKDARIMGSFLALIYGLSFLGLCYMTYKGMNCMIEKQIEVKKLENTDLERGDCTCFLKNEYIGDLRDKQQLVLANWKAYYILTMANLILTGFSINKVEVLTHVNNILAIGIICVIIHFMHTIRTTRELIKTYDN